MKNRPVTAGLAAWAAMILLLLAACGGNELAINATKSEETTIAEPALVVREWYPRSKYTPRSTLQFDTSLQGRQQLMLQQTGSVDYRGPVTSQPVFADKNKANVQQPVADPWSLPLDLQQSSGQQEHRSIPGQQYQQRPWGEITYPVTQGNRRPRTQQQGVVVPYGTRQPGYAAYPGYPYGGAPYDAYSGHGYPGFMW
jgi:hypothetical protein